MPVHVETSRKKCVVEKITPHFSLRKVLLKLYRSLIRSKLQPDKTYLGSGTKLRHGEKQEIVNINKTSPAPPPAPKNEPVKQSNNPSSVVKSLDITKVIYLLKLGLGQTWKNLDGRMPILILSIWVEDMEGVPTIMHSIYKKKVDS